MLFLISIKYNVALYLHFFTLKNSEKMLSEYLFSQMSQFSLRIVFNEPKAIAVDSSSKQQYKARNW